MDSDPSVASLLQDDGTEGFGSFRMTGTEGFAPQDDARSG